MSLSNRTSSHIMCPVSRHAGLVVGRRISSAAAALDVSSAVSPACLPDALVGRLSHSATLFLLSITRRVVGYNVSYGRLGFTAA